MAWLNYDQLTAAYDRDRAVPLEALEPWRVALAAPASEPTACCGCSPDAEFFRGLEALERAAAADTTPTPVIRRLDLLVFQASR
ncbi:MAG TPA: hypothetical protein VFD04_21970 [Actinomycetes bacterium]|jgi:hypothetical protein|nr:hypothetical protein [Actinomycetes bacterium]